MPTIVPYHYTINYDLSSTTVVTTYYVLYTILIYHTYHVMYRSLSLPTVLRSLCAVSDTGSFRAIGLGIIQALQLPADLPFYKRINYIRSTILFFTALSSSSPVSRPPEEPRLGPGAAKAPLRPPLQEAAEHLGGGGGARLSTT